MPAGDREIALRWVASRVASRFLATTMKRLAAWDMDMLARLSILEGAAGVPPGTWLRQKSGGFGPALDHFGSKLSAAWTTSRSQGIYDRAVATATRMLSRSSGTDPMDLVQNMVSGSTSSTGSARHRLFYSVGNALRKDESGLTSGDVTPSHRYVLGTIDRWVKRAALDILDLARERRQQKPMTTWRAPGTGGLNDTQRVNLLLLALQRPGGPGNEVRRSIDREIDRAFPPASRPIVRAFLQKIGDPKYHSPQEMKRLVSRFDPRKWFVQAVNLVRKEIMNEFGLTSQQMTRALGGQAALVFEFMRERIGKNLRVRKIIEGLADEIELTEPGMAHLAERNGELMLEHAVLRRWLEKKEREATLTSSNAFAGVVDDESSLDEEFEPNEYAEWGDAMPPVRALQPRAVTSSSRVGVDGGSTSMMVSGLPFRVARRRPARVAAASASLLEAVVLLRVAKELLHVAKEPVTTNPEFARWVETQRFRHPQTGNNVQFKSLPVEEQTKIRARWQQTNPQEEEDRQRRGPGDEEKRRGEKKEEPYYDQRRRRDEQSFAKWLADQDDDLVKTWESDRPTARPYVREKFEKDQKRTPTYPRQKENEAKEKRWKEWLGEQGDDAKNAWADGSMAEKLKVRGEFAKKEKVEGDERRKKFDEEREKRRVPVDKFRSMSKEERPKDWVLSDNGNRLFGPSAEISAEANLEKTDVAGKVEGQSDLRNSRVESGSRVSGSTMRGSVVKDHSVVEDGCVLTGVKVSDRARIRGSKISNAELRGGTWDDLEFDGNNGVFHDSYDPDTLRVLGSIKSHGTRGPGDGPLRAMVRYLADGGRTKGWFGGEHNREKLTHKIQQHIYDSYDRKDPWLGRGADFIEKLDDQGFEHLMGVAQKKVDEIEAGRRKKAMLYELTKTAIERLELRAKLLPLVRLGRDSRVATEGPALRRAVIKAAYESNDPELKEVLVRCIVAVDQSPLQIESVLPQRERVEIVRAAYGSRDPERRRSLLARVAYDAEHHDSLIDALSVERDAWDHPLAITADEGRELIRLAYETKNVGRRREILGLLKEAKYSPGFMKWVEKQKFKQPETGNSVQFVSLPTNEQKKIHEQWKTGKKEWAQKFKPEGLGDDTLLTPEKFDQLKPGNRLWISWNPGVVHEVTGMNKTSTGKPVLEMEITNSKTGKKQTRYMHRSSAGDPQHEIHVLPEGVQPKDPKKAPKPEEKAEAEPEKKKKTDDAKVSDDAKDSLDAMNANAKSWMDALGMPGHGAEFGDEDAPFAEDEIIEIKEGGYAPLKLKIKAPKLVVGPTWKAMMAEYLPGQNLEGTTLIPIGNKYEPKSMKKVEDPKALGKKKEPEKAEAPKATGKHQDRKKLVGKGKSGDAKVHMTATVKEGFVPEGLSEEAKEATEARLKVLTYDGLRKLEFNVRAAVEDPEGAYAKALAESGYAPGDLSKMHATIKDLLKGADGRTYNKTVLNIANRYDLESEDADELAKFKGDKPGFGRKLTPNELMQKFLAKAKPETKERMQGMAIDDFMVMYKAIMADEDEEVAEENLS